MILNHQEHQGHQDIANLDNLAKNIVDCVFCVHKEMGPGLLENAYEVFLLHELSERGINARVQVPVQVKYKNKIVDVGYRLDLLVEDKIIVELKTVEAILPLHQAQILTYLRLANKKLGFLVNFNAPLIKNGIKRYSL